MVQAVKLLVDKINHHGCSIAVREKAVPMEKFQYDDESCYEPQHSGMHVGSIHFIKARLSTAGLGNLIASSCIPSS